MYVRIAPFTTFLHVVYTAPALALSSGFAASCFTQTASARSGPPKTRCRPLQGSFACVRSCKHLVSKRFGWFFPGCGGAGTQEHAGPGKAERANQV